MHGVSFVLKVTTGVFNVVLLWPDCSSVPAYQSCVRASLRYWSFLLL